MERKPYYFTDNQRFYITELLFKRQEKLGERAAIYRQKWRRDKALEELSEIYAIIHELYEDDFKPTD